MVRPGCQQSFGRGSWACGSALRAYSCGGWRWRGKSQGPFPETASTQQVTNTAQKVLKVLYTRAGALRLTCPPWHLKVSILDQYSLISLKITLVRSRSVKGLPVPDQDSLEWNILEIVWCPWNGGNLFAFLQANRYFNNENQTGKYCVCGQVTCFLHLIKWYCILSGRIWWARL